MPAEISENWEYFVPNPEIVAVMGGPTVRTAFGDYGIFREETGRHVNHGFRFGRSISAINSPMLRLAPAWLSRRTDRRPIRRCLCGCWFTPNKACRVYCSADCVPVFIRQLPDRRCAGCGREFRPAKASRRCCSGGCASVVRRLDRRSCVVCRIPFKPKQATQVHCSQFCGGVTAAGKRLAAGKVGGPVRRQWRPCEWCRTPFLPRRPDRRFCSKRCSATRQHNSQPTFSLKHVQYIG